MARKVKVKVKKSKSLEPKTEGPMHEKRESARSKASEKRAGKT